MLGRQVGRLFGSKTLLLVLGPRVEPNRVVSSECFGLKSGVTTDETGFDHFVGTNTAGCARNSFLTHDVLASGLELKVRGPSW
jgi:hypothetical protein